ncbi:MAG: hypothetical protein R3344_05270, partial [Acidobacteriota bacterium]|nr:hypothetical protein [Acidobacteriota bacterium]
MKAKHLLLVAAVLTVACGPSEREITLRSFDELVAAERAFARASVETTPHDAFMQYLGEDSILFLPTPVAGRESMEARPMDGNLSWEPAFADIAVAGDLGYT